MLPVDIDPADPQPLHEQVAGALRRAIAEGRLAAGQRLPPARDLAAALEVNPNTVLRALRALRGEGLLEFRRGRGITVTATAAPRGAVVAAAQLFIDTGRRHGYRRHDLIRLLEDLP